MHNPREAIHDEIIQSEREWDLKVLPSSTLPSQDCNASVSIPPAKGVERSRLRGVVGLCRGRVQTFYDFAEKSRPSLQFNSKNLPRKWLSLRFN
jgi:hypothetical protein